MKPSHIVRVLTGVLVCFQIGASLPVQAQAQAQNPAQSFPSRPLRVVIPFTAGGTLDWLVRHVGEEMSRSLRQPIIIENRPGAGTVIGVDAIAKAAPDGHSLVIVANSFTANHTLVPKLPYDSLRDLTPVGMIAVTANVLLAHPGVPGATLADLIQHAKSNPGKLSYGSFGNGTTPHLAAEMLKSMTGIDIVHVPYKGLPQVMLDLSGNQIQLAFGNLPSALPLIRSGKLKSFGVTYLERSRLAPDLPTVAEQGLAGFETNSWYGYLAPGATPAAIVRRLNAELVRALGIDQVRDEMIRRGLDPIPGTPEQMGEFVRAEITKNGRIIKSANIKVD